MTLKLTLKPGESVFVGTTRVSVVSRSTCTVLIEGTAPVMRAAEWLDEAEATTPLFGPYTLVNDVNQLTFGADPVVELAAGESFTTDNAGVAAFLDEHPSVKRAPATTAAKKPARKAAG